MRYSEKLTTGGHEVLLNGTESWPLVGALITESEVREILSSWVGWKRYWMCYEKAKFVAERVGGFVILGSLKVYSGDFLSIYGFDYNPPFEFHSWVYTQKNGGGFIDLALPGVIELGTKFKDEKGPFLVGRDPVIIASGHIPNWLEYTVDHMEFVKKEK